MRTFRSFAIFFAAAIAGSFAIAGCKSSVTAPGGGGGSIIAPNTGSYFITVNTQTDSTGTVTYDDTEKDEVVQTNVTIYGMSGVTVILDSDYQQGIQDTSYLKYEANGDIMEYQESASSIPTGWYTFPFGSQNSSTIVNVDTIIGDYARGHVVISLSGAGSGSVNVQGQSLYTNNLKEMGAITDTVTFPTYSVGSITFTNTVWFAPSLGYIAEQDQPAYETDGTMNPASHSQLISYVLK